MTVSELVSILAQCNEKDEVMIDIGYPPVRVAERKAKYGHRNVHPINGVEDTYEQVILLEL